LGFIKIWVVEMRFCPESIKKDFFDVALQSNNDDTENKVFKSNGKKE